MLVKEMESTSVSIWVAAELFVFSPARNPFLVEGFGAQDDGNNMSKDGE